MNKSIMMMFISLLVFSRSVFACGWSVTVLEKDDTVVSINLGCVVPEKTPFEIPGVASCNVFNDGKIYTVCTYEDTDNSVAVTPLNDSTLGKMSNMMIFDNKAEEMSKQYLVITMCSDLLPDS